MEGLTIVISVAGAAIAFILGPVGALLTYFMILFYYPQPLTIPLGTVEFNSSRIVILGVIANALLRGGQLKRFKFDKLDFWIVMQWLLMGVAFTVNVDTTRVLIGRGGAIFDTLLPYFAVRIMINDRKKLVSLIKWCTAGLLPLALAGIYEAKTGHNLYSPFAPYYSWGLQGPNADPNYMRHGLYRASASLGNYISFGMLFAGLIPLALGLWFDRHWNKMTVLAVAGGLAVGLISAMSSGPTFSIVISLGMMALFKLRDKWPIFVIGCLVATIFVEVFSNRHFYYVLTWFAFDQETAYYRIGLVEECFGGGMKGHWLFGYGYVGVGPGNDNSHFLWEHQDLTNIYIRYLARSGLLSLIPFVIINFLYYKRLYQSSKYFRNTNDAWLVWCLGAALAGWNFAMMTVAALAQIETLLYMFIGLCANMPGIMRQGSEAPATPRQVRPAPQTILLPRESEERKKKARLIGPLGVRLRGT